MPKLAPLRLRCFTATHSTPMIRNIDHPSNDARIPPDGGTRRSNSAPRLYDRSFWFCYGSNTMLMIAVSLLFRYADYVTLLGGNERHLGTIVGVGMFDVGNLIGQPAVGNTLHFAEQLGLPKYATMFVLVALFLIVVASIYAWFTRRAASNFHRRSDRRIKSRTRVPRDRSPRFRAGPNSPVSAPGEDSRFRQR